MKIKFNDSGREKQRRTLSSIYLTREEFSLIKQAAQYSSMPFSSFIRAVAVAKSRQILSEKEVFA